MPDACKHLHQIVYRLPEMRWPFFRSQLPTNGIYFFHETGEAWGHGGDRPRIVRVGTHREGNFRSRMSDHYVENPRKMLFGHTKPAPKDRSIFRKNIGRALLHRDQHPYAQVWNLDFTTRALRDTHGGLRDIEIERAVEEEVTRLLRERFAFRWIELAGQERRMGSTGMEAVLIGTLASCKLCSPSPAWLGLNSPKSKIAESGLWLEQHLRAPGMTPEDLDMLERLVEEQVTA